MNKKWQAKLHHLQCVSDAVIFPTLGYFFPNNIFSIAPPIFLSTPAFDVGMPVTRAIFCLSLVIPKARFHEKLNPGIGVDFFVIFLFYLSARLQCKSKKYY
jgi:hypothetical protein